MRPTAGVRYELVRQQTSGDGELLYAGSAHTPDASYPLRVRIALPGGATSAEVQAPDELRAALEKAAAALVRAATKTMIHEGRRVPRRIVRWRA